ncbi:MAG: M48 family metallopeptidase [Desulfomonilia bacterium]|nr:M48 family metallopeptidase [Desulfomonilia bacterium]
MQVEIPGAGTITIEHSARARRLIISVSHTAMRVRVPRGVPLEHGRIFALERTEWIRKHIKHCRTRKQAQDNLMRTLPPITDARLASQTIISRCRELSARTGLACSRITIRNQKTRWGSCSRNTTISLNITLARLPRHLMDYVILHELLHTRIRGHGPEFWKALDSHVGDARALRRELKRYAPSLT